MEAVFRAFPDRSVAFFIQMSKRGMFLGMINTISILFTLWMCFSTISYSDLLGLFMLLVKLVLTMVQLPCKLLLIRNFENISLMLQQRQERAVDLLIQLQEHSVWKLNHKMGKYSLYWILVTGVVMYVFPISSNLSYYLFYFFWFNAAMLIWSFLKTAQWLNIVVPGLGVGAKLGAATSAEINQNTVLSRYVAANQQGGQPDQCPICFEEYKDGDAIRTLKCKHVYHDSCILTWLTNQRTCPYCKKVL